VTEHSLEAKVMIAHCPLLFVTVLALILLQTTALLRTSSGSPIAVHHQRTSTQRQLFSFLFPKDDSRTGIAIIDAVKSRNMDTIEAVLARAAGNRAVAVNEKDPATGDNAMHYISRKGHYAFPPMKIPTYLIDVGGIDINATNADNQTALEIALLSGWQKIAMLLLDRGADRSVVTADVKSRIRCPDCKRVVKDNNL
jgi:ankyrin repeat protein